MNEGDHCADDKALSTTTTTVTATANYKVYFFRLELGCVCMAVCLPCIWHAVVRM